MVFQASVVVMRVAMMTREYPPEIYGGAGVHVTELTRYMRELVEVDVHCMGAPRDEAGVFVHGVDPALDDANPAIKTLSTGLRIATAANNVDVAHSHTWSLRTHWSLTVRGNVNNWAAVMRCPAGLKRTLWNTRML